MLCAQNLDGANKVVRKLCDMDSKLIEGEYVYVCGPGLGALYDRYCI
jgi:hypothetical protein